MGCTSEGARRAADQDYRHNIAGADSADLSQPLPIDLNDATLNRGPQPNDRGGVVISPRFNGPADTATFVLINWSTNKAGQLVALSKRTTAEFTAGPEMDAAGRFYAEEQILPCTAPLFELRALAVTGQVSVLKAWDI